MKEMIDAFVTTATGILISYGPISGVLLIILESILPVLPLSVFITLNIISYGSVFGFLISWISTVIGCMLSFSIFRHFFQKSFNKFVNKKDLTKLKKIMDSISDINFSNLVIFIAIPFSPAFLINIAAGLSKIKAEKFFMASVVGKGVMVYFWAYIGKSLLESLTDITVLIRIGLLLIIAQVFSKLVEKRLKLK